MRVYSQYEFHTGKRYTISELFDIIDVFLSEQGLHYDQLCYDFCSYDSSKIYSAVPSTSEAYNWAQKHLKRISDCHELFRKQNEFGEPVRKPLGNDYKFHLSNLDENGAILSGLCTEEMVRAVGKKIPRPYNFHEAVFMYHGIDFFSRNTPLIEAPVESTMNRVYTQCSQISIFRQFNGPQTTRLYMTIDVTDGDYVLDAEQYARALSTALGNLRYTNRTLTAMSAVERRQYAICIEQAKSTVSSISESMALLNERFCVPPIKGQRNIQSNNFAVAKSLKRIAKTFGFTEYQYSPIGVYFLTKRTEAGHFLTLAVDVPNMFNEIRLSAHFCGIGFDYTFPMHQYYVENQEIADGILHTAFENLCTLERGVIQELGAFFPETPQWYQKKWS